MWFKNNGLIRLFFIAICAFGCTFSFTEAALPSHQLYVNQMKVNDFNALKKDPDFLNLTASISNDQNNSNNLEFFHVIKNVNHNDSIITIEDGSEWLIGWWSSGNIKDWKPGNRIRMCYLPSFFSSNDTKIQNVDVPESSSAWASLKSNPTEPDRIARIPNGVNEGADVYRKVILKSGWIFRGSQEHMFGNLGWNVKDRVFIFHKDGGGNVYDLWNQNVGGVAYDCTLIGTEKQKKDINIAIDNVLNLEKNLNKLVLAQPEAAKSVAAAILNYCAGLKDPGTPVAVFLFLGPTGVGKTEMAKALTSEIYKNSSALIRFDMSHFTEPHSLSRLIGSPPGYVNHEEGGQLTEALKNNPQSIVLLDEIEKAHPAVRKVFLPIFDEGYVVDAKDQKILCDNVVFILTSNICSQEVSELYSQGMDTKEILATIEPLLMETLSPELYNRIEPIVFCSLTPETMKDLVDLMLKRVEKRLKETKSFKLVIDQSVKDYLIKNGYHPRLGARPLKKMIEKKVIASIAYAVIKESIPDGSTVSIYYFAGDDSWHVTWVPG